MISQVKFTTHGRLLSNVFTRKITPFHALKELINNSLLADAKNITIDIKTKLLPNVLFPVIAEIEVSDDGYGVSFSEFSGIIMKIATNRRVDGLGVGRFSALQIGRVMDIETVAYDRQINKYTITKLRLDVALLDEEDLENQDFAVEHEELDDAKPYYKVRISSLYNNDDGCSPRNKLGNDFKEDVLPLKIFENYPEYIYKEKVKFKVWGKTIEKNDYCQEDPTTKSTKYTDTFGKVHDISIKFVTLKLKGKSSRIFLQGNSVPVAEFSYTSNWIDPDKGTQLIYVESDAINSDLCANFSLETFGQKEWALFSAALKEALDEHFKNGDARYTTFLEKLKKDKFYPYKNAGKEDSLPVSIFDRSAYIIEGDSKLITNNDASRELVYCLMKKVIEDGDTRFIVDNVIGLSRENKKKFIELLDITNLDSIVRFSSEIAGRKSEISFMRDVVDNKNSKTLDARKNLAAILLKNIWMLGDHYQALQLSAVEDPIQNAIDSNYRKYLDYKPTRKNGNMLEGCPNGRRSIGSHYLCGERWVDYHKKEILFIDIRAPHFCLSQIELNRFDQLGFELENSSEIPKEGYRYKLYMICNEMSEIIASTLSSRRKKLNSEREIEPFYYNTLDTKGKDISLYVLTWEDLFKLNESKLTTQSEQIVIRKQNAEVKFIQQYEEYMDSKAKSIIRMIK